MHKKGNQDREQMKMIRKIGMAIIVLIIIAMTLFIGIVMVTGQGKIQKFYGTDGKELPNSIAERTYVDINGRKNGMIIRGKSMDNPVLLFISGGPGVPQYWLNEYYENQIEDDFTVCWWDWAGEGLSYDASMQPEDITIDSLCKDAKEVAKYLRNRFGKEKVYLMAHSGGTPLGLRLAETDAEDFYCYFGMGQYVNDRGSRYTEGYQYMKEYFTKTNDIKSLTKLQTLMQKEADGVMRPVDEESIGNPWEGLLLKAGCGTTRQMRSDAIEIFFPQMFSHCYTLPEKINFWKGKALNQKSAYSKYSPTIQNEKTVIPVYFISGRYDYTCPVILTEKLYENLEAPGKGMYIFENSAHSPLWEENEKVLQVMKDFK